MTTRKTSTTKTPSTAEIPAAPKPRTRRPAVVRRAAPAPDQVVSPRPETPAEERIRVRAYYLHLERRGRPADPTADWLTAEQELREGSGRTGQQPQG